MSLVLLESCYTRAGILLHRSPGASYVSPWDVFDASYPNWREEVSLQVWKTKTNLRKKGLGYLNMTLTNVSTKSRMRSSELAANSRSRSVEPLPTKSKSILPCVKDKMK